MERKTINLEDFICAISYQHKHYIDKPIMLSCGHVICLKFLNDFKKKTELKKVKCLKCSKENSLEIDYVESDLMKNYMNLFSDKMLEDLKNKFEETQRKARSKNKLLLLIHIFIFIFIEETINEMDEHVEVQINYWKEEVEIRAESIKIEIDKIKDSLIVELDKIKRDFK